MKTSFVKMFSFGLLLFVASYLNAQTASDEKSILGMMDSWMELSKTGDADALAALYADNATAIFYNGMVVNGKQAIHETLKQFMSNPNPDDTMEIDSKSVRFLDASHAILMYGLHGTSVMEGQKMDWKAVGTAVLVKRGSNWLIELNQDTAVMEMPGQ